MLDLSMARYIAIISVAIYFIYEHFDGKHLKDEREEMIRLKAYELVQKLMLWALTVVAAGLIFFPFIPAIYPVMMLVLAYMYGEIFGKIYFRRKM